MNSFGSGNNTFHLIRGLNGYEKTTENFELIERKQSRTPRRWWRWVAFNILFGGAVFGFSWYMCTVEPRLAVPYAAVPVICILLLLNISVLRELAYTSARTLAQFQSREAVISTLTFFSIVLLLAFAVHLAFQNTVRAASWYSELLRTKPPFDFSSFRVGNAMTEASV